MGRSTRHVKDILWAVALAGLMAAIFRLWFGLGATTNLSDAMPWGLWKVLNMIAGVALSTSGFTIGLLVYVFKLERFRPYVKPAILVAFLGYGCSVTALLFDIGLPHKFWHPIFMWNVHSFLFEVFWCVLLYFTVTAIELLPIIVERIRSANIVRWLHRMAFGVVVIGISLSSLPHSSLGSMFLVSPTRLHPLWYSPLLPIFFILSAMGAGIMVVVLVRILYAYWYDPEPVFGPESTKIDGRTCVISDPLTGVRPQVVRGREMPQLSQLAAIAASVLGVYLILKLVDLDRLGAWEILAAGTWESWLYGFELMITAVVPILLLLIPATRRSPAGIGLAALSATAGLVLNRLDVGIFGYLYSSASLYVPTLAEWAVGLGVVAAAALVLLYVAENFSIFDDLWKDRQSIRGEFQVAFDSISRVWSTALSDSLHRVTLIAVFVILMAWMLMYPPFSAAGTRALAVQPSAGIDPARTMLRIDGNRSGVLTNFPHAEHQKRLQCDSICVVCHHVSMPNDYSTPCSRCHRGMFEFTPIFNHTDHLSFIVAKEKLTGWHPENKSCIICHTPDQPKQTTGGKPCLECHDNDIWCNLVPIDTADMRHACSFGEAMHGTCLECHTREAVRLNKKGLGDCGTCHPSRRLKELPSKANKTAIAASS